jgi:hypothetical protein
MELVVSNNITKSLGSIFERYESEKLSIQRLIAAFNQEPGLKYFDINAAVLCSAMNENDAIKALNASYWATVMQLTDVLDCMPAQKRNEWSKRISDKETPTFDIETVTATIEILLLNRETFFAEKVDGIFKNLSGRHVTNSPLAFGEKLIMEGFYEHKFTYVNHTRIEYLHDLRNVILKIRGQNQEQYYTTSSLIHQIVRRQEFGKKFYFDGSAFSICLFKIGTIHIEIHEEIAVSLNRVLASLHPSVIASSDKIKKAFKRSSVVLESRQINNSVCYILTESIKRMKDNTFHLNFEDASNQDKETVYDVIKFIGGEITKNVIVKFTYDPSDVIFYLALTGRYPDKKSHQFYGTQVSLAERMVEMANIDAKDSVLEPSAGQGGIAQFLPKDRTTCIEIAKVQCKILESKGFTVINKDFIDYSGKTFDRIVMNPPFNKGQAKSHVCHAYSLLNKNGVLVACLPSSLKGKILVDGVDHEWTETINDSFEDTAVSVVLLTLHK